MTSVSARFALGLRQQSDANSLHSTENRYSFGPMKGFSYLQAVSQPDRSFSYPESVLPRFSHQRSIQYCPFVFGMTIVGAEPVAQGM
jgi:hypothetical protein